MPADSTIAAASGDSALVQRLERWTGRRFHDSRHDLDYTDWPVRARAGPSPRIASRLRGESRDTVVAVQLGAVPLVPAHAVGTVVRLADPSGITTPLEARVLARRAFRAPQSARADSMRTSGWRYGWTYLVELPDSTSRAHTGAFANWLIVPAPVEKPRVSTARRRGTAAAIAARDSVAGVAGDALRGAPQDSLRGAPRDALRGAPQDSLRGAPRDALPAAARDSLRGVARDSVRPAAPDSVHPFARDVVRDSL
jgi:hypothetical protein